MDYLLHPPIDLLLGGFKLLDYSLSLVTTPTTAILAWMFPKLATMTEAGLKAIQSPYTKDLALMGPANMLMLLGLYLLMINVGPMVFRTKRSGTTYTSAHNLLMTAVSLLLGIEVTRQAWKHGYALFGNPLYLDHPRMARVVGLFYACKILEFNDTLIMLLKQNYRQITFLHTYHHASIFVIWWLVTLWAPTGDSYFSVMLNSFVHVVMYGYYFLTGIGEERVRMVKKYITSMQMTQFALMQLQATYNLLFVHPYASKQKMDNAKPYPMTLSVLLWVYMASMLALFANFYKQDRIREKEASAWKGTPEYAAAQARAMAEKQARTVFEKEE